MYEQSIEFFSRDTALELKTDLQNFIAERNPRKYIDLIQVVNGVKFSCLIIYHL